MSVIVGLDIGTSTISVVAVDETGTVIESLTRKHGASLSGLEAGLAEQDPNRLLETSLSLLAELAGTLPEPPRAIALTGQMHSTVLLDQQVRPVGNVITWQDRRALKPCGEGEGSSWLEAALSRCREEDLAATGCRLAAGYLGTTLFTLQQSGTMPAGVHCAVQPADWIAATLCGIPPVTDRTNAGSSGLYDFVQDRWSRQLTDSLGISRDLLPQVVRSGIPIGHLAVEMARRTRLPEEVLVCCAIGDNQASVLGSSFRKPVLQVTIGTGGQINWPVDHFLRVDGMDTRYFPDDRFLLVGAGLVGGDAYAWLARTVCGWQKSFGEAVPEEEVYAKLERLAGSVPGDADGLVCEPFFRGTRRQPQARGSFYGIGVDNFTPGHLARAILNGIADGMASFLIQAGDHAPSDRSRIVAAGNGIRNNPLLQQILGERLGGRIEMAPYDEPAAVGAALLASDRIS